jgi:sulfate adenylyltransferase subunit 2
LTEIYIWNVALDLQDDFSHIFGDQSWAFPLEPNEVPELRSVRFRTLGCYPLSGAIESDASNVSEIIDEMRASRFSERQGRLIDGDGSASMEAKKREGYF